jgi:hypothetical protein
LGEHRAQEYAQDVPDETWHPSSTRDTKATLVICVECGRRWQVVQERWCAYWTDGDPPELAFYCSECAKAEFG